MMNNVTPCRVRKFDEKAGRAIETGEYKVDVEALPGLVARGVVPYRFMLDRVDFSARFAGCGDAIGVRAILASEGYYG